MDPAGIAFSEPLPRPEVVGRIAARWRLWRERHRWPREVANVAALGRIEDVLEDVGITRAELDTLTAAPLDAGRQFPALAGMAGADLSKFAPEAVREAAWACTRCGHRDACRRWLRTGQWRDGGDMRCPNAALYRAP